MTIPWQVLDYFAAHKLWCRWMREQGLIAGKFPPTNDEERALVARAKEKTK
ncbi:MAG: hypothetical protein KGN98_09945 [Alphaproteobacteria bacterium]|nr:hypothetical protein [Alphaproteobacteria bacterium]